MISGMAQLQPMPSLAWPTEIIAKFGEQWIANGNSLSRSRPYSSMQLGNVFDEAVANALALMLGGIDVAKPNATSLIPIKPDCVELGPMRIVGGVRPQNFDVGYRPDGVRFAYDSKTLNDKTSVGKNYQNMINDLATEATTVHSRFPYAIVAFMVVVPAPCLEDPQRAAIIETLERLGTRTATTDGAHLAESIALVVWNPVDGTLNDQWPPQESPLRYERFSVRVEEVYRQRYKGLPPHTSTPD